MSNQTTARLVIAAGLPATISSGFARRAAFLAPQLVAGLGEGTVINTDLTADGFPTTITRGDDKVIPALGYTPDMDSTSLEALLPSRSGHDCAPCWAATKRTFKNVLFVAC